MKKLIKNKIFIFLSLNLFNISISDENFYDKGLKFYDDKKYNDAKFMFEKSIVFNPKDSNSYLYLAKSTIIKKIKKRRKKFRCNIID